MVFTAFAVNRLQASSGQEAGAVCLQRKGWGCGILAGNVVSASCSPSPATLGSSVTPVSCALGLSCAMMAALSSAAHQYVRVTRVRQSHVRRVFTVLKALAVCNNFIGRSVRHGQLHK